MNAKTRKFDYTWVIVAMCFLMSFVGLGFCSGNKSLYLTAMTEALGIKRSLFAFNDTCRYLATTAVSLFFGSLMHRFGTRRLVATGFLFLCASCLLYATAENVWVIYLGGFCLGLGLSLSGTTMVSFIIKRWCTHNTGKFLGIGLAANGIGSAVAAQIVTPIIHEPGNPFGYRNAYYLICVLLVVAGAIIVLLLRDHPPAALPEQTEKKRGQDWEGIDFAHAVKKPYFYIAAVCIFFTGMILQGVAGISAAQMQSKGISTDFIATVVSVQSLVLACSKFLIGAGYDKYGLRRTILVCHLGAMIALPLMTMVSNTALGRGLAMTYGILSYLAMPLETIMLSLISVELFGNRAFAQTMGIFSAVNTAGFAVGAPLMNWCYDVWGTYDPVYLICAVVMLAVTVSFQIIITVADRDKKALLANR